MIGSATDLSGNGYHAAQAGAIRPAWNNGRAEFTSGDFLKATGVDFSGTDVVTFIAAVYKASDTKAVSLMEHGLGVSGNQPGVRLSGPPYNNGGGFGATSNGTTLAGAQNAPNSPAPIYAVVTIICRISTDTCLVRVNGVVAEVSLSDQGTGNFQLADLFINAGFGGTNLWAISNHYQNLVIDKELTEVELNNVETAFGVSVGVTIGAPKFTIAAMGDSFTYATGTPGVTANDAYVKQIDARQSRIVYSANLGESGDTTAEMMNRRWQLLRVGTPNMAIIYGSINDLAANTTVSASPTPTATVFTISGAFGYAPDGWITVAGEQAQVLSVSGSEITLTAPLVGGAPSAGADVAVDTQKNLTEMALYVKNAGCKRVMVLGLHYYNLAVGADTTSVEAPDNATLRAKQQAAATAAGVVYVDLYAWQRDLIIAGTRTQGNYAEHRSSSDPHLSLLGQTTLADAIEATIISQGWT